MIPDRLYSVVLAAGRAARYGTPKQLAVLRGETLVGRATRLAESVLGDRSVLVVGHDWRRVHAAAAPLAGFLVVNERYREGMGGSIAAGVRILPPDAVGVVLLLADQPLVTRTRLEQLIARHAGAPDAIVCSTYDGTQGPPVIFPRACFAALSELRGDRGARAVIDGYRGSVIRVRCPEGASDIDTPGDLASLDDPG